MKRIINPLFFALMALGSTLAINKANAQTIPFLDAAVSPASQTAAPGSSPFWDIQLTNNNAAAAYFTFIGFNDGLGATPNVTVPIYNLTPFGHQYTLAANSSVTIGSLFQTIVSPGAANATYFSAADVTYDLYDSSSFSSVLTSGADASADWTLQVLKPTGPPSSVPEPGAVALLVCGGVSGGAMLLKRRRKALSKRD